MVQNLNRNLTKEDIQMEISLLNYATYNQKNENYTNDEANSLHTSHNGPTTIQNIGKGKIFSFILNNSAKK